MLRTTHTMLSISIALATVSALPALAVMDQPDYRIELKKDLGGLNIVANTFAGPAVTLGLENRSDVTADCRASFVGYPHRPLGDEMYRVSIPAGKNATLAYPYGKLGTTTSIAFVELTCSRAKPGK